MAAAVRSMTGIAHDDRRTHRRVRTRRRWQLRGGAHGGGKRGVKDKVGAVPSSLTKERAREI